MNELLYRVQSFFPDMGFRSDMIVDVHKDTYLRIHTILCIYSVGRERAGPIIPGCGGDIVVGNLSLVPQLNMGGSRHYFLPSQPPTNNYQLPANALNASTALSRT